MIRERQRHQFDSGPMHCLPGDKLFVQVTDQKTGRIEHYEEEIGRSMVIDTIVTVDVKDEFGLEDGIGAIFGKAS